MVIARVNGPQTGWGVSTLGNLHPHCGLGLRGGGFGVGFPRVGGAQKHPGVPRVEAEEAICENSRWIGCGVGQRDSGAAPSQRTVHREFLVSLKKAQNAVLGKGSFLDKPTTRFANQEEQH